VTWALTIAILLGLALFGVLLAGPLIFGRFFLPRLTLKAVRRWGRLMARLTDRIKPGLDMELLVKAGNRYFRDRFAATPFNERILFLPICLKPQDCPAEVDSETGLLCRGDCPDCRLGQVRQEAVNLGYARVFIVPSSRLLRGRGFLPSDQFMLTKLRQHAPRAALGVLCGWYLRQRLLPTYTMGRGGVASKEGGPSTIVQGVLLNGHNCRRATVDWDQLRWRLGLAAASGGQVPAGSLAGASGRYD